MYADNYFTTIENVRMPPMIYGTAWKKDQTEDMVYKAVKAGFRGIDTACQPRHYFEAGVGDALERLFDEGINRDELFIQTKFTPESGQDRHSIPYDETAPFEEQVLQSFEVSQKNLRCDTVDSLVLHSPLYPLTNLMKVWRGMESVYANGGAKQLGISNCYELPWLEYLYENATVKPAVVQNRFYADSGYDIALRQWCSEKGIIYQSFWTLTANPFILKHPVVDTICEKYGQGPAAILYRYLTQSGVAPLNGTTSLEHMQSDLAIFDFRLDEESLTSISALIKEFAGN